jgi:hypothetical protein
MDSNLPTDPSEIERNAAIAVRQATKLLHVVRADLEADIDRVVALDTSVTDAEMRKAISRFKEAFHTLVKERQTFDRDIYGRSGPLNAEPVDLVAARSEVGRLLDSLRTAGRSGEVSG